MRGVVGSGTRWPTRCAKPRRSTPQRVVLVDGDIRLDCQNLYRQATTLAQAMLVRMPAGSVVSFMLPNWHEAAVIYLAATLAGMVVNPILPSLRDRELLFILADARQPDDLRAFEFGATTMPSMLTRVTANDGSRRPRSWCCAARPGGCPHSLRIPAAASATARNCRRWIPTRSGWCSTPRARRDVRKVCCTAITRSMH